MAIDIYGKVTPYAVASFDLTSLKFKPLVLELLPRGAAWDREGEVLNKLCAAESIELSRVDQRATNLERELNPNFTYELIEDWETSYGLPDCDQPTTLEGRRGALKVKLLAQTGHTHSYSWWNSLTELISYSLWWIDVGPDLCDCNDECIDPLSQETFIFFLGVEHGADDDLLACLVAKNALLISGPIIHYLWTPVVGLLAEDFTGICCTTKGWTLVVSDTGDVYISNDLVIWTILAFVGPVGFYCCTSVGPVMLAGGGTGMGGIARSDDNGFTWLIWGGFTVNCDVQGLCRGSFADGVAVAVGEDGRIFRTTDTGISWAEMVSPAVWYLYAVASGIGVIIAVGNAGIGGIIRSFDDGITWEFVAVPAMTGDLYAIHGFHDTFIAVGASGKIFRSTDQGSSWTDTTNPSFAFQLQGVAGNQKKRWTACGVSGLVLTSTDDGLTWGAQNLGAIADTLNCAAIHRPDGRSMVAGANSTIVLE
jgi:uncharacterized protein YmfQ (DUF2313 family)